jgi:predicted acyltransferase
MERKGRFESLDALRGLAVLGMAWSGMLPDTLPPWMYHAQLPPPNHIFNDQIFGLTWVDLVFPFFLFSMGSAIPIALSRRLERGQSPLSVTGSLLLRGLLLALFAVYGEHLRAGEWSQTPDRATWGVTILGWILLLLMFIRWPKSVPKKLGKLLTAIGWIGATALIATHVYPDGNRGFENSRNDIILMVLANVAVTGGFLWLVTRCRPLWRILAAAAVGLVLLTSTAPNSLGKMIWDFTPLQYLHWESWPNSRFVPVFYHFEYHKYLLIVLAGTFCGDLVLNAMNSEAAANTWPRWKSGLLFALCAAAPIVACWGLFARETIATGLALIGIGLAALWLTSRAASPIETLISRASRYGLGLVLLGVLAEPVGGGIRKDEPTLSYFLLTAGLGFWLIAALEVIFDMARQGKWLRLITWTGMNPILGYITITNFVIAMDGLTGYSDWLAGTSLGDYPWAMAFLSGGVKTLLVAVVASLFTRSKVFLRT